MDAYGYCYQNPIRFIDPDGKQALDPIEIILSYSSTGNHLGFKILKPYGVSMSTKNFSGTFKIVTALKDQSKTNNIIGTILGVGAAEYKRSVSIYTLKTIGQYYDEKGNKVNKITDASKLIVSKYSKKETVRLEGLAGTNIDKNSISVEEKTETMIYNVINGKLTFKDEVISTAVNEKSYSNASDEIKNLASSTADENEQKLNKETKKLAAKLYEQKTVSEELERNREKNMTSDAKKSN